MSALRSFRLFEIAALLIAVGLGNLTPCRAEPPSVPPAEPVEISTSPLPFDLRGLLRRPARTGRFPAVVLLPACGGYAGLTDEDWGARLSSWGLNDPKQKRNQTNLYSFPFGAILGS